MSLAYNVNKIEGAEPFLPTWVILSFISAILILFWLLFPDKQLRVQVLNATPGQPIAAYYLPHLIDNHPKDIALRFALIREEIALHHWQAALQQINKLSDFPGTAIERNILIFQLNYTKAFQISDNMEKQKAIQQLRKDIQQFKNVALSQQQLNYLAPTALSLNEPMLALGFYKQYSNINEVNVFRTIAKTALGVSDYSYSAKNSLLAMQHEKDVNLQRLDIHRALMALQMGSLFQQGIDLIAQLPESVINNKEMLIYLTKYCLAANRPDLAQIYITRALAMRR